MQSVDVFERALNALLSDDIVVKAVTEVETDFHARYRARGRAYRYSIWNGDVPKAIGRQYVHQVRRRLDEHAMNVGGRHLEGIHDFASFAGAPDPSKPGGSTIRELFRCNCAREGDMVLVDVAANAFLPQMVRNIVGTLLWVGIRKIGPEDVRTILESHDRRSAGPTAPARGLCLVAVWY